MALFKRRHIHKIREGRKTQTRRTHKHTWKLGKTYSIRASYFGKPEGHIKITKKFKQKLGEISPEDVKKEGFNSLEEFREAWIEINGNWNPEQIITAYEFKLLKNMEKLSVKDDDEEAN